MTQLEADGTFTKISDKWFGIDVTQACLEADSASWTMRKAASRRCRLFLAGRDARPLLLRYARFRDPFMMCALLRTTSIAHVHDFPARPIASGPRTRRLLTIKFAVLSMFFGLIAGSVLAVMGISHNRVLKWIARVYVSLMRGTPLLVQIFVIYYGLPSLGISLDPTPAGVIALSANVAAYLSESMRGAILGIHSGQWLAAYSLGLSRTPDAALCDRAAGVAHRRAEPVEQPDQPDQGHVAGVGDHGDRTACAARRK